MHAEALEALGQALYGPRYATYLAEALSRHTSMPVTTPHVSLWAKGKRGIPDWVGAAAFRVAEEGVRDLEARRDVVRAMLASPFEHGMPGLKPAD